MVVHVDDWPLIGRARELAAVSGALMRRAASGVLLAGPPGVGKSRLAGECLGRATGHGFHVEHVRATRSSSQIPLGALAPLLPFDNTGEVAGDVLRGVAAAIGAARDDGRRVLLAVDDAHLLDDASATVVNHLVTSGRCSVMLTVRSGESAPDPVTALWKDLAVERLDIGPLIPDHVDELLTVVLGGRVDGVTRREFWDASHGNALFVRELLLGALDSGVLGHDGTIWRLEQRLASPPRLIELVEARLGDLAADERTVIELVALGEPIDVDLLTAAGGEMPSLEGLARRGLVALHDDGGRRRIGLAHPLHGDVLRRSMTAITRMALSRRLADAADRGLADPDDLVKVAVWRLDGGGDVDAELMLAAARRAFFASDLDLAGRLCRAAMIPAAGLDPGLLLAQVLEVQSRHEEADVLLRDLEAEAATDEQATLVSIQRSVTLVWGLDRGDDALAALRATAQRVAAGPWRDELEAQAVTVEALLGDVDAVVRRGWPMVGPTASPSRASVTAAVGMAPVLAAAGRASDALDVADRAFAARLELGDLEIMSEAGIHLVARALALGELGRLAEAAGTADLGYDGSIAARSTLGQGWFALLRGRVALLSGRLAFAVDQCCEGAAAFGRAGRAGARRWCGAGRVIAAAMRDDRVELDAAVTELDAMGPSSMLLMEPDVVRARAWADVARGLHTAGRTQLVGAAGLAAEQGAWSLALAAWHDLARIGDAPAAHAGLAAVAPRVEGPLAAARVAHVAAAVRNDPDGLGDAAERFEALGALLFAADALADGAVELARAGQLRAAQRMQHRAEDLAARCEGARTPALARAGTAPDLTRREREVAGLAARGLSSKRIAEELGMSVRTVDSHLRTTYVKLGITSRTELPGALPGAVGQSESA